jgi:hypothetical protein
VYSWAAETNEIGVPGLDHFTIAAQICPVRMYGMIAMSGITMIRSETFEWKTVSRWFGPVQ